MESHQLVNQTSGEVEFGTPREIIEAAREVMGRISLDPATSKKFNETVKARAIFTKEDDGLSQEWFGNIWMNHPFAKGERACVKPCKKKTCPKRGHHIMVDMPGNSDWISKLVKEYRAKRVVQACCITFASTSEEWFNPLLWRPQCFLVPRTNYYKLDGTIMSGITKGSVVTYFGPNKDKFAYIFKKFGVVKEAMTDQIADVVKPE